MVNVESDDDSVKEELLDNIVYDLSDDGSDDDSEIDYNFAEKFEQLDLKKSDNRKCATQFLHNLGKKV